MMQFLTRSGVKWTNSSEKSLYVETIYCVTRRSGQSFTAEIMAYSGAKF